MLCFWKCGKCIWWNDKNRHHFINVFVLTLLSNFKMISLGFFKKNDSFGENGLVADQTPKTNSTHDLNPVFLKPYPLPPHTTPNRCYSTSHKPAAHPVPPLVPCCCLSHLHQSSPTSVFSADSSIFARTILGLAF